MDGHARRRSWRWQRCSSLVAFDLDVAITGADLSLDPFELVGFSRAGALAPELMRVYDCALGGFLDRVRAAASW